MVIYFFFDYLVCTKSTRFTPIVISDTTVIITATKEILKTKNNLALDFNTNLDIAQKHKYNQILDKLLEKCVTNYDDVIQKWFYNNSTYVKSGNTLQLAQPISDVSSDYEPTFEDKVQGWYQEFGNEDFAYWMATEMEKDN